MADKYTVRKFVDEGEIPGEESYSVFFTKDVEKLGDPVYHGQARPVNYRWVQMHKHEADNLCHKLNTGQ